MNKISKWFGRLSEWKALSIPLGVTFLLGFIASRLNMTLWLHIAFGAAAFVFGCACKYWWDQAREQTFDWPDSIDVETVTVEVEAVNDDRE